MLTPKAAMRTPVALEPWLGNTGDGETYGTARTVWVNAQPGEQVRRSSSADTEVRTATVAARPDAGITVNDRVTLNGSTYLVSAVVPRYVAGRVFELQVRLG